MSRSSLFRTVVIIAAAVMAGLPAGSGEPWQAAGILSEEGADFTVEDLLGAPVYGSSDGLVAGEGVPDPAALDLVGTVVGLVRDPDGTPTAVVIWPRGFLGLGPIHVTLPLETLSFLPDPDDPRSAIVVHRLGREEFENFAGARGDTGEGPMALPPIDLPTTNGRGQEVSDGGDPAAEEEPAVASEDSNSVQEEPAMAAESVREVPGAPDFAAAEVAPERIRASRGFAGPDEYPPEDFAGYGIVVFDGRPESERGRMFCDAFAATFVTESVLTERGVPPSRQMVTVWPLASARAAEAAKNAATDAEACAVAVSAYGLLAAEDALAHAEAAILAGTPGDLSGRGPFLLA